MFIRIEKEKRRTIAKQIYLELRKKILNGELEEFAALPSTRELSSELSISRNTVLTAYEMLVSEGFSTGVPGSGYYVNQGIRPVPPNQGINAVQPSIMIENVQTAALSDDRLPQDIISFDSGIPALDLFPRSKWNSCVSEAFRNAPASVLGYDDPQGRPELRTVLASYLKSTRGIQCSPDQIMITSGAKQGLTLTAKCLLDTDSEVVVEDPSNRNVNRIFSYHTKHIIPVPVDREGIMTEKLPAGKNPVFLFVTPSHQFPMGGVLTVRRRLELIRYAQESGCLLVEDDYDSEYRYSGIPAGSLYEYDPDRVIYIGTFSKVLFPSLRLGYMVLPPHLIPKFREWKRLSDHHSNSVSQLALMRFIECGDLERHIRKMRKVYRSRKDHMLGLLNRYFPDQHQVLGGSAGMHLILNLNKVGFTPDLVHEIRKAGVYIVPVEEHAMIKDHHENQIILGYAHLSPHDMEEGLKRLKETIIAFK